MSSDFAAFASHRPYCDSICNTLHKIGKIRGPPQGLAVEEIVHILVRAAESAKHDAKSRKIAQHFSYISAEMFRRPPGETSMVHHSDLSRDGRSVLVVLMNSLGKLSQRRVVPFDGSGQEHLVGPRMPFVQREPGASTASGCM